MLYCVARCVIQIQMKSVTHRVTSILLYLRLDSQPHLRRRYVTLLMSVWVLCVYNKKGALTQPQPGLCREATPYAVLQPPKQRRPHPRHPVSRSGARTQWFPQEQIYGEAAGIRRRPSRITDGTDAFDTLYIGCENFTQHALYPIAVCGVR